MNTHIITFIIIATGVMSGLVIAVIALAISLEKLKEELSSQRIVYPCGCVYLSYGKFGHFVRYSGCNLPPNPSLPSQSPPQLQRPRSSYICEAYDRNDGAKPTLE